MPFMVHDNSFKRDLHGLFIVPFLVAGDC